MSDVANDFQLKNLSNLAHMLINPQRSATSMPEAPIEHFLKSSGLLGYNRSDGTAQVAPNIRGGAPVPYEVRDVAEQYAKKFNDTLYNLRHNLPAETLARLSTKGFMAPELIEEIKKPEVNRWIPRPYEQTQAVSGRQEAIDPLIQMSGATARARGRSSIVPGRGFTRSLSPGIRGASAISVPGAPAVQPMVAPSVNVPGQQGVAPPANAPVQQGVAPPPPLPMPAFPPISIPPVRPPLQYTQPLMPPAGGSQQMQSIDPHMESHLAYNRDETFRRLKEQEQYQPYPVEARFAAMNPHEERAENLASDPENVNEYKRYLNEATAMNLATGAPFKEVVNDYMNPYQEHVVNRIAELGKRNLEENILPTLDARFISAGQHGSSGHQRLATRAARDIGKEIAAQQRLALHEGYGQAADIYSQDQKRRSEMGRVHGTLGQTMQSQRLNEINALSALGAQQRAIEQEQGNHIYDEEMRRRAHPLEQMQMMRSNLSGMPHPTMLHTKAAPAQGAPALRSSDWGLGLLGTVGQRFANPSLWGKS